MSLFGQGNGSRSYGFSLKALLEDPNLQNAPSSQTNFTNLKKPGSSKFGGYVQNTNSAFLGSNLWEQPSDNRSGDFDLQYMDLDEFLSENGIPVDPNETDDAQTISLLASALAKTPPSSPQRSSPGLDLNLGPISPQESHQQYSVRDQLSPPNRLSLYMPDSPVRQAVDPLSLSPTIASPDPISRVGRDPVRKSPQVHSVGAAPQSEIEKCLLDDNFGIKSPVIGMGQKKIKVTDVDFNLKHQDLPLVSIPAYRQNNNDHQQHSSSPPHLVTSPTHAHSPDYDYLSDFGSDGEGEGRYPDEHDIGQACLPGQANFDPKKRKFSEEELKPQPIIKKSKKVFVDDSCKDEKYWSRRKKNNVAAKRSRDARRVKENQIAMRASFLESQYDLMKEELNRVKIENIDLLKRLSKYEAVDVPSTDMSN